MKDSLEEQIRQSRLLLRNPYAYLDGEGGFDAIPSQAGRVEASRPQDVHDARRRLENPYAYLDGEGGFSKFQMVDPPIHPSEIRIRPKLVRGGKPRDIGFNRARIASFVRTLQVELWRHRKSNSPNSNKLDPIEILDPSLALNSIGFDVKFSEKLGTVSGAGEIYETAGIIDGDRRLVQIAERFAPEIQNFTMAHELGHAILHKTVGLHRDKPLDGDISSRHRSKTEAEADLFAVHFLMPEKLVRSEFRLRFGAQKFVVNDDSAFSLVPGGLKFIEENLRTTRDLARLLAASEQYQGRHFESLAKRFRVSVEAMAIRLEELELIDW